MLIVHRVENHKLQIAFEKEKCRYPDHDEVLSVPPHPMTCDHIMCLNSKLIYLYRLIRMYAGYGLCGPQGL
jgi:hypothetical protein